MQIVLSSKNSGIRQITIGMKNVNILTIHKEPNYGAVLQAYALYKVVKLLGHNPRIINLSMEYRHFPYNLKYRTMLSLHKWIKGYSRCYGIAEAFSKRYCPNQIGNFHTLGELESYNWDIDDYYLIGSDQVWNPAITQKLSNAFCLSFLGDDALNRYAYAASLGHIEDEAARKAALDMASLAKFKRIAVREQFGVEFLRHCGIAATEVLDPTLLLEDYMELLPRKVEERDEILFLSLSDTEPMNKFVSDLSARMGLPVSKHYGYLQPRRSDNMKFMPVEEWLYAIASSRMVVTDSFHATVFAILFRRPFFVYISKPSKVARISNLLANLGISGRIVGNVADTKIAPEINYDDVASNLVAYRTDSMNYIKAILE